MLLMDTQIVLPSNNSLVSTHDIVAVMNSMGSAAPPPMDEFETFFQEADKTAEIQAKAAESRRGSLPTHSLAPPGAGAGGGGGGGDSLRRAASCKCAPTRKRSTRHASRSPARRSSPENDQEPRYITEASLRAPSPMDKSVSQPQSRTSSWKNMRRPRSFRDLTPGKAGSQTQIDQEGSPGSRTDSVAFEESVSAKLEELRLLEEENFCVVRSFAISPGKGLVNRGDSFKRKTRTAAQKKADLPPPATPCKSASSTKPVVESPLTVSSASSSTKRGQGQPRNRDEVKDAAAATTAAATSKRSRVHSVLVLGDHGVGKTSLLQQFMTSEYMGAVDSSFDGCDRTVSVVLNGEETMIKFLDGGNNKSVSCYGNDISAYLVVYSAVEQQTLSYAADTLLDLKRKGSGQQTPGEANVIILVANKTDLVRKRKVTSEEGRSIASQNHCKYIELSAALNHKVDDLLVGIVAQIRLHATLDSRQHLDSNANDRCSTPPAESATSPIATSASPTSRNPGTTATDTTAASRTSRIGCISGFVDRLFRFRKRPAITGSCDNLQKL